jgi:hypothetical protein
MNFFLHFSSLKILKILYCVYVWNEIFTSTQYFGLFLREKETVKMGTIAFSYVYRAFLHATELKSKTIFALIFLKNSRIPTELSNHVMSVLCNS